MIIVIVDSIALHSDTLTGAYDVEDAIRGLPWNWRPLCILYYIVNLYLGLRTPATRCSIVSQTDHRIQLPLMYPLSCIELVERYLLLWPKGWSSTFYCGHGAAER